MFDHFALTDVVAVATVTYLVHSTLFLGGCWLLLRVTRNRSPALADRVWKVAAVAAFMTTSVQLIGQSDLGYIIELRPNHQVSRSIDSGAAIALDHAESTTPHASSASSSDWVVSGSFSPAAASPESAHESSSRKGLSVESLTVEKIPQRDEFAIAIAKSSPRRVTRDPELAVETNASRAWSNPSWTLALSVLLGASVVFGLIRTGCQSLLLSRRVAESNLLSRGRVRRSLDRLVTSNRVGQKIRLISNDRQREPVAFGWRSWTILVPNDVDRQLDDDQLTAMLAHELAHFVRGDTKWLFLGRLLCNCFAFQKLNFLARRSWRQASEYLCDQWAVERGTPPLTLARCLTTLATRRANQGLHVVSLAATGTKKTIVDRVERLVTRRSTRDLWCSRNGVNLCRMFAIGIIVVVAAGGPRTRMVVAESEPNGTGVIPVQTASRAGLEFLDSELLALRSDIENLNTLASRDGRSEEVKQHLGSITDAMSSIDRRHQRLKRSFSQGDSK